MNCKLCGATQFKKIISKGEVDYFKCLYCGLIMQFPLPCEKNPKIYMIGGTLIFGMRRKGLII